MYTLTMNKRPYDKVVAILIERAVKYGFIRDTNWLYNRSIEGLFYQCDKNKKESKRFVDRLSSMMNVLNNVYKDRWDFTLEPVIEKGNVTSLNLGIIIHYPKIKITNSKKMKHTIRDLFVHLLIRKIPEFKEWSLTDISGTRSTFSHDEYNVSYLHSHTRSINTDSITFYEPFKLYPFCLGDNNDITTQLDILAVKYTPEEFELLLWNIESIIRWESLEGVPYNRIENIYNSNSYLIRNYVTCTSGFKSTFNSIMTKINSFDADFVFNNNKYKIIKNYRFENFIRKQILKHSLEEYKKYLLIIKQGDNHYRGYIESPLLNEQLIMNSIKKDNEYPYFYLRDKKIEFKLIVDKKTSAYTKIDKYNVNPNFLNYVSNEIEKRLYEKAIRKSAIERKYIINNT